MLQLLLSGQKSIKDDIKNLDEKLSKKIDTNTERLDKFGMDLAHLSDDAPVMEDFEILEQKVEKLEHKFVTLQKE